MDLKNIIKHIESDKCVLLVGTELPFVLNKLDRQKTILNHLKENGLPNLLQFKEDDFFYFSKANERLKAYNEITELYENISLNEIYDKIAQIPFSLTISLSPDLLLKESHSKIYGPDSFDYEYYKKGEYKDIPNYPTKNHPAIYSLMGDISDDDSIVLTFDDLFSYFSSLFGDFKIAEKIRLKLNDAKYFIFIGFNFHAWYYKLLLRVLDIDESKLNYYYPNDESDNLTNLDKTDNVLLFLDAHFKMQFSNLNVEDFINMLHSKIRLVGGLRKRAKITAFDYSRLHMFIKEDKIDEAIRQFDDYFKKQPNHEMIDIYTLSCNKYENYKKKKLMESSTSEELNIYRSSVINKFLELGKLISKDS